MKKLFTLALLVTALFFQHTLRAQNTSSPSLNTISEMLPGTWEWTESRFASRGVKPTVKTPASESKNVAVTFRPDNLASVYVNKKFSGMYQYTLSQPMGDYVLISFKANEGQPLPEFLQEGPITINDNEIFIAGGYNDAGQNVKFRKAGTKPTPPKAPETKKATQSKTKVKQKSDTRKKAATTQKKP